MNKEEKNIENVIADLYEIRGNITNLKRKGYLDINPFEHTQYAILTMLISIISDKYKIRHKDIEEVLIKRSLNKDYE